MITQVLPSFKERLISVTIIRDDGKLESVVVNMETVEQIQTVPSNDGKRRVRIWFCTGFSLIVEESPDEILRLIRSGEGPTRLGKVSE